MKRFHALRLPLFGLLVALPLLASAQKKPVKSMDFGQQEFLSQCASCHGRDGKGNGPIADLLRKPPPDLTTLTRGNGDLPPLPIPFKSSKSCSRLIDFDG